MRKAGVSFAVIAFIFCAVSVNAQEYAQKGKSSQGVESKKIGGASVIAPKGSKLIKKEGATFVEGLREYTSRKFAEVESRLKNLESENAELKKAIAELNGKIQQLRNELVVSAKKEPEK